MRITLNEDGGPVETTIIPVSDECIHIAFYRSYQLKIPINDARELARGILECCDLATKVQS